MALIITPVAFLGIPNLYTQSFTVPDNASWPIVGYVTIQNNAYVTVPSTSALFMVD